MDECVACVDKKLEINVITENENGKCSNNEIDVNRQSNMSSFARDGMPLRNNDDEQDSKPIEEYSEKLDEKPKETKVETKTQTKAQKHESEWERRAF